MSKEERIRGCICEPEMINAFCPVHVNQLPQHQHEYSLVVEWEIATKTEARAGESPREWTKSKLKRARVLRCSCGSEESR